MRQEFALTELIKKENTTIVSDDGTKTSESKAKTRPSSQLQLLQLAKSFALDGALVAEEKQMPIDDRCVIRARSDAQRKQKNLEAIINRAMHYCSNAQSTAKPDVDWFSHFTVLAESISNKTMQDLWAKILAGETMKPGSFSYRALSTFKTLSIHDAKLIAKATALACKDSSEKSMRIITSCYKTPSFFSFLTGGSKSHPVNLAQNGLNYTDLLNLMDNQLVFSQETETRPYKKGETLRFTYNGKPLNLVANVDNVVLQYYKFTPIGAELANLISDKPDEEFLTHLTTQLSPCFSC